MFFAFLAGAFVLGLGIALAHQPTRVKWAIALRPSWKRSAALYSFSDSDEVNAEADLLVSATVLRDACDVRWLEGAPMPSALLTGVAPGTVVFVNAKHLSTFCAHVLPRLSSDIVLVSGCDTVAPSEHGAASILTSPRIRHWFVQNIDFDPPAHVTPIPVGLNFHKLDPESGNRSTDMGLPARPGNQQLTLLAIRDSIPPLRERPLRAYANFHLNMDTFLRSKESRKRARARGEARAALRHAPWIDWERRQSPRHEVWKRHRDVAFEICPHGNGLDCHRTWEALALCTVPIVKRSRLDALYDGMPVAIVDDWSEIDEARLAQWVDEFADALSGDVPAYLKSSYWTAQFFRGQEERLAC